MGGQFDVDHVINEATVAEKVALLSGKDFWHTHPLPRFNVPSVRVSDGPNGIRGTKFFGGVPAACLPCGTGLAATWDLDLLRRAGELIGLEAKAKGAHCWLGPTINIQRSPLGGRGFESLSEDPYLSGKLAGSYINGCQSTGVIATIKHFVANDQEHERMAVNVVVNDRALREIYLLPFQIAISDSAPGALMTSYNKVNGLHVSENPTIIDDVLRKEWKWDGLIMSDWFGTYSTNEALKAGLDLEMPGGTRWRGTIAELAVTSRKVTMETLDARVRNVLNFVKRASAVEVSKEEGKRDFPEDQALNRKLAGDGMVLLNNEKGILPLNPKDGDSIALIGSSWKNVAFCGGGSASLEPYYAVSPYQGVVNRLKQTSVNIIHETGAYGHGQLPTLGEHCTAPNGSRGMRVRFYSEPASTPSRTPVDEVLITDSFWQLAGYSHPQLSNIFYADIEGTFTAPETGDWELSLAVFGTGNLFLDGKLIVDNTTVQRSGSSFFGKGTVEEKATIPMTKGSKYDLKVQFGSAATSKVMKPGVLSYGGGAGRVGCIQLFNEDIAIAKAAKIASEATYAILCVGLSQDWESEGFDRTHMRLPGRVPELVRAVLKANSNTVLITQSGTPIDMNWDVPVPTLLHAWYSGNEIGNALADVIFGDVNPSGHLPLSMPKRIQDTPAFLNFESERGRVVYGESIYVGYRYYEKLETDVLFPFGHGLSYTTFQHSDLNVYKDHVTLEVVNTGKVAGSDVVQLYIAADPAKTSISRPVKELKGFAKVFLQSGEKTTVTISLDKYCVAFWDEILNRWVDEKGTYDILIGRSSADITLKGKFEVSRTSTWNGL